MPSYPSSTCATNGSYCGSDYNDAELPNRSFKNRETSKPKIVNRKHTFTASSPVTSTTKSTTSKSANPNQVGANKVEHTSSTSSPSYGPTSNANDGFSAYLDQTLNQEYSISRFYTDDDALGIHADSYISAQDTTQAHTSSMKTHLDDFDMVFYTD